MKIIRVCILSIALLLSCALTAQPVYKAQNFYHLVNPVMPGFSESMLNLHFKLYEGYVKTTNELIELLDEESMKNSTNSLKFAGLKRLFGWNYDGMRLHEYYFENLGGKRSLSPTSSLYKRIENDFGSYDAWRADFVATGMIRGVGWSALYFDPRANRLFNVWINEHDGGNLVGDDLILVMDVWEHAYITEYGLNRMDYIEAFMKNVNWNIASNRYEIALKK